MRRVKQAHAAELLGVAQSTVSRWEEGELPVDRRYADQLENLLAARLGPGDDHALVSLVGTTTNAVHLICDVTHRLLACSPARRREFGANADALMDRSLWPYASEAVVETERAVMREGWSERALIAATVEFETGANGSDVVPIRPSRCRWTRLMLSDGSVVRLVETLQTRLIRSMCDGSSARLASVA